MAFGDIIRSMGGAVAPAAPTRARVRSAPIIVAAAPPPLVLPTLPVVAPPTPPTVAAEPASTIVRAKPVLDHAHVTRMVAQADAAPQVERSGGNADHYMHASSLIGCCEREHCISRQMGLPISNTVTGPMRLIWAIGRAVERHVRDNVITTRNYQGVYGEWHCACKAARYVGEHVAGRVCQVCRTPVNRYAEPVLQNDFVRAVGSPDLTLIEQGWYMPVEIKSMNKEQFDKLEAPLADHCIQGSTYRWLYEQLGFPVLDIIPVVYVRKDYKFGGTRAIYKEYHTPYSDWARQVENNMETSRRIDGHTQMGTLPERTLCTSASSPRAKDCRRAALCFSL